MSLGRIFRSSSASELMSGLYSDGNNQHARLLTSCRLRDSAAFCCWCPAGKWQLSHQTFLAHLPFLNTCHIIMRVEVFFALASSTCQGSLNTSPIGLCCQSQSDVKVTIVCDERCSQGPCLQLVRAAHAHHSTELPVFVMYLIHGSMSQEVPVWTMTKVSCQMQLLEWILALLA